MTSTNHLVTRNVAKDPQQSEIINFWKPLSDSIGNTVVGKVNEDITGDSNSCRCEETPMVDLVADAILFGTRDPEHGGAQLALMNTGGVRASLLVAPTGTETEPGQVRYREAYDVAPFNNILVTVDLTTEQLEAVLNQQYQRIPARGSRPMLSLGVSQGFTYTWAWEGAAPAPNTQPSTATTGGHVVPGSMALNGQPLQPGQVVRVGTLSFLADGGDSFTAFTAGSNRVGGPEDLANLVAFLEAHREAGLNRPGDRILGL